MKHKPIPFLRLKPIRPEVKAVVDEILDNGVLMNGTYLQDFKDAFSKYLNLNHVIPTANCTDALEIILRSLKIKEGDEVITSAFSWFSDASVIKIVNAKLVFCDINIDHFGIDIMDLESKISANTKAIILPHLFGMVHPNIEKIAALCDQHEIFLIEDCAQAQGATFNEKLAGTFGSVAAFSFYPTKILGALGDAGAIATNHESAAKEYQLWANHGQINRNEHVQLGRNSRMDELQAGVLSAKLPFLDVENEKRRRFAEIYFYLLQDAACVLPVKGKGHVYHQFVIRTDRRDELKKYLHGRGIETDIHYPIALPDMVAFSTDETYPSAILASRTVLSIPIHPNHSEDEIEFVGQQIKGFFRD